VQGVRVAVAGSGEKGNRSAFGQIGSRIVRSEGRVYARVVWCAGARSPSSVAFPFAQFAKFTKWRTQSVFAFSHEVESPASLSLAFCVFGACSAISRGCLHLQSVPFFLQVLFEKKTIYGTPVPDLVG
jgi:hypothetical protein